MYTKIRRGKLKSKITLLFFSIIILAFTTSSLIYATSEDLKDMDNTIDEQNTYLYDAIMKNRGKGANDLKEMLKESDRRNADGAGANIDIPGIGKAVEINIIKLSLWARKYIVPFTIMILLFNIFMFATTGVKNYGNRKQYIYGSIFLYVFFLVILNLPLYILWRRSLGIEAPFTFDGFYLFVEGLTSFLKKQSFVISLIILSYGLINYIGSETNLPKRLASVYVMKASALLFVLFQIMPLILKLAV